MQRSLEHSNRHFKNVIKHLPLGVPSNIRYWGEGKSIYVDHRKGGPVTDVDGNKNFEQAVDITITNHSAKQTKPDKRSQKN